MQTEKRFGIPFSLIALVFSLKIAASLLNLYFHVYVEAMSDVSFYHHVALQELSVWHKNPNLFLREWLLNWGDIDGKFNIFERSSTVYWSNLGSLLHSKFMVLCNILSGKNLFINVLFYNIVFLIGQLYFFGLLQSKAPDKKWLMFFIVFLIPSVLFWCSGIHKDGWILSALGIIIYQADRYYHTRHKKHIAFLLLASFIFFIIRYFYFMLLIPPILMWLSSRPFANKVAYFVGLYTFLTIAIFAIPKWIPSINPPGMIVNKYLDFKTLEGSSNLSTPDLQATISSFAEYFPYAMKQVWLSPPLAPYTNIYQLFSLADALMILACIGVLIARLDRRAFQNPLVLFLLFYGLSAYTIIGYTITNLGAMARYKSEFTVLILSALLLANKSKYLLRWNDKLCLWVSKLSLYTKTLFTSK